jgi:AbrB family looped-hinge helix DNA binding protein
VHVLNPLRKAVKPWRQLHNLLSSITFLSEYYRSNPMATTVTIKGQVTLPKKVREAAGIKPGDRVEVRATASGTVVIQKPGAGEAYRAKLYALANRRLIRGTTTDELMKMLRGDPAEDPPLKKK